MVFKEVYYNVKNPGSYGGVEARRLSGAGREYPAKKVQRTPAQEMPLTAPEKIVHINIF